MKKFTKVAAIIAAAVMVLGSSMTVFGATSVATASATAADASGVAAVTADGTAVSVAAVSESVVADASKAAVALLGSTTGTLQVEKVFELNATLTGPTDITISVPGVTAGQYVSVLHQMKNGQWESVPVTNVSAGSVTATFTSLSPVAIVTFASPKTGEANGALVSVICIISLLGAAVCFKKYAVR